MRRVTSLLSERTIARIGNRSHEWWLLLPLITELDAAISIERIAHINRNSFHLGD